jgi:hypothetical protein
VELKIGDKISVRPDLQKQMIDVIIVRGPFEIIAASTYSNKIIGYETLGIGNGKHHLLLKAGNDIVFSTQRL